MKPEVSVSCGVHTDVFRACGSPVLASNSSSNEHVQACPSGFAGGISPPQLGAACEEVTGVEGVLAETVTPPELDESVTGGELGAGAESVIGDELITGEDPETGTEPVTDTEPVPAPGTGDAVDPAVVVPAEAPVPAVVDTGACAAPFAAGIVEVVVPVLTGADPRPAPLDFVVGFVNTDDGVAACFDPVRLVLPCAPATPRDRGTRLRDA